MFKTVRITALLTAFLVVLMVFATGCGSQNSDTTTGTSTGATQAATEATQPTTAQPMELTWIGFFNGAVPVVDNTPVQKLIEEKFNVKLTLPKVDIYSQEQWNLYWASGNTADLITSVDFVDGVWKKLVDQNLVRPITEDMIRQNMPVYIQKTESIFDPSIVKSQLYYKDKVYGIPICNYTNSQAAIAALRQDWMDNVGVTKVPETIDELHDLLKKFTFNDPDKNGKKDTYGMHGADYGNCYIFGAYGIQKNSYYLKDGKVVYSQAMPEYKQVLKLLNSWYKEGIIDLEFLTDDRAKLRAKWSQGLFGMMQDHPWWYDGNTADNMQKLVTQNNPNAKLVFFDPPKGPNGLRGSRITYPNLFNNCCLFGKDTSDEKVKKIMEILEYSTANKDFALRVQYGEAGVDYDLVDGVVIPKTTDADTLKNKGLGGIMVSPVWDNNDMKLFVTKENLPLYEASMKKDMWSWFGVSFNTNGTNTVVSQKQADIQKVVDEFYANTISGNTDIDQGWDGYLKKLDSVGLKEVIDEYQKIAVLN